MAAAVKERPPLEGREPAQIRAACLAERAHRTRQFGKEPIQFTDEWVYFAGQWRLAAVWFPSQSDKPGNHGFRIAYGHVTKLEAWAPGTYIAVNLSEELPCTKLRLALDLAFGVFDQEPGDER